MKQKEKTCAHCGEIFLPERRNGIYCSNTCRQYSYLSRKNGEIYGLPKNQVPIEYKNEVPALLIEENEERESIMVNEPSIHNQSPPVNYQFKEKSKESNSINTVASIDWNYSGSSNNSINNQTTKKAESMKTEQLNNQQTETQLKIPVLEFDNDQFHLIENLESSNVDDTENLLPKKSYADLLEEEKQNVNFLLKNFWEFSKSDKGAKFIVNKFCKKIKPYFKSLASMDQKSVTIKTLTILQNDMEKIGNATLPTTSCPTCFQPIGYYERVVEHRLKEFILDTDPNICKTVRLNFSNKQRVRHELMLKLMESFSGNTPDNWLLP